MALAGQLIREDNSLLNNTFVYTYDNGGNLLTKQIYALTAEGVAPTNPINTYTYGYGAYNWGDLLLSYRGVSFQYDRIGNPLSYYNGSEYTFTWENGRRLATAQVGTFNLSFTYNDEGIRTSKTVNGVKHTYGLNGSQIISEEWGGTLLVYLYDAAGSPIGMQYRERFFAEGVFETYWFEKNLQGDIVAVYDERGVKQISYTYDAWGNFQIEFYDECTYSDPVAQNPFLYRGYYYDAELGMYYLQSRYYDPVIGRFINADNNFSNNNLFMYCANNPANASDPDGHHWYYLWMDDLIQAVKDLLACSSNIVFGKAAQKQAYYDPQGAAELWRSRPFQDVTPSKEMQIFTEFMYEHDFVVDTSITLDLKFLVKNAYFKIGISELLSANKNFNATYVHAGVGSSYSIGPPVSVSYSVGFVQGVNNKLDYAKSFMDIGGVAVFGVDYCWWNSSALCFTVSNSIGLYAGYDYYWCID